jgi:hypothetical protein
LAPHGINTRFGIRIPGSTIVIVFSELVPVVDIQIGPQPPASFIYCIGQKVAIKSYDIFDWTLGLSSGGDGGFSIHVPVASRRVGPYEGRFHNVAVVRSFVSKYGMSPRNDDRWVTSCLQEHRMD